MKKIILPRTHCSSLDLANDECMCRTGMHGRGKTHAALASNVA